MKALFVITLLAVFVGVVLCLDHEYEEKSPLPQPRHIRGSPRIQPKQLISKTTSTEPPLEDPTYYDEVVEEEQKEELQTTTTEAPKKTLLRGSVRPFKSNEDLLAALRKRRLLDGKPSQPSTKTPNTVPSAASQSNSAEQTSVRRGKSNPNTSANETGGRKFSPRGGSKQLSQQQDVTSTEQPVEQAKVSRFRGRKS